MIKVRLCDTLVFMINNVDILNYFQCLMNYGGTLNFAKLKRHRRCRFNKPKFVVRAMYFGGLATSPRNSPHCLQNQKNTPLGVF